MDTAFMTGFSKTRGLYFPLVQIDLDPENIRSRYPGFRNFKRAYPEIRDREIGQILATATAVYTNRALYVYFFV